MTGERLVFALNWNRICDLGTNTHSPLLRLETSICPPNSSFGGHSRATAGGVYDVGCGAVETGAAQRARWAKVGAKKARGILILFVIVLKFPQAVVCV